MNKGSNSRRSRGRGKGHGGGQGRPQKIHNFDSNGPEGRVRGNAQQVYEKYLAMARDAMSAGDRIAMENYFQHAEHYLRVIMAQDNGAGRMEAIRRRAQFGPYGPDEFSEEGEEMQGSGAAQGASQGERSEETREAGPRDNGGRDNGQNARRVPIETSDDRGGPKQADDGDDGDDDEGLKRTLAI
jgi:hypothetical protein